VHRFVGVVNRRDLDAVMEFFAEDAVLVGGPRFPEPIFGRAAIRALFEHYFRAFTEMLFVPSETFTDGNETLAILTLSATVAPRIPGTASVSATSGDRRVSWRGAYRFEFDPQGKILRLAIYGDESTQRWVAPPGAPLGRVP
jgi:ketosteroid isomerase-like protein